MARVHAANEARCDNCGAPRVPGLAGCDYCRHAYPGVAPGPKCPSCDVVNVAGSLACGRCRLGIARTCVFCGGASPLDAAACVRCREAFAGAEQRKQQRDEAARNKRYMDLAGVGIQTAGVVISSGAAEGFLDAVSSLINTLSDND